MAIIASILGILVFIVIEVWPLFRGASVEEGETLTLAGPAPGALLGDEYLSHVATLSLDGRVRALRVEDGEMVLDLPLLPEAAESVEPAESATTEGDELAEAPGPDPPAAPPAATALSRVAVVPGRQAFSAASSDGRAALARMTWGIGYDEEGERVVTPRLRPPVVFDLDPEGRPLGAFAARLDEEGGATAAAQLADGTLAVLRRETEENLFTGEVTESWARFTASSPLPLEVLLLDAQQRNLYGGAESGEVLWWRLGPEGPSRPDVIPAGSSPVTAMTLLLGDRALVVGREDGTLRVWFQVRGGDDNFQLTPIRDFPRRGAAIRLLSPSLRDKGFLAQDEAGGLGLYYSTSRRVLWEGDSPLSGATALFFAPKADGALLAEAGRLITLEVERRHPEVGLRAFFGKVWYEGLSEPAHVWQSTGGTDDFEPKLGMTPLLVGTLKGTFYSLLLAIPLGVLGAMYTSQFMHARLKRMVKPTVEIMAALPSVVLGFLAGLWLAPRLERFFPALLLMLVAAPLTMIASGLLWRSLPRAFRNRVPAGSETLLSMAFLVLVLGACLVLSRPAEELLFAGDFQAWLYQSTGLRYDQRNAVVVGLAMGFAVIPIIFSIAEDAFSNVPTHLTAGSLALGATRWQTVTRVVLPTASPGIFSAIMIGLGRAVGETMIVLMATGNTPIMDWSPFNGFRTLSANIAVEIPEAPQGGTLYRTLFLAALLLFILTFLLNTVAELVRQRLRKRYAEI
jgi:phosphate transport system permease protein